MTATWQDLTDRRAAVSTAVGRASRLLLASQEATGCWGSQSDDVTPMAEGVLVGAFLGRGTADQAHHAAARIRALQRADGGWAGDGSGPGGGERTGGSHAGGSASGLREFGAGEACRAAAPGCSTDLAASVLAYLALRLAGDSPDAYHMAAAAGWIREAGGSGGAGVAVSTWLALFGLAAWDVADVPGPEVLYLAPRGGVRDWATWSRQALATLSVIGAVRSIRQVPFGLGELRVGERSAPAGQEPVAPRLPVPGPARSAAQAAGSAVRAAALRRCGQALIDWQLRDGWPDAPRPVWPLTLIALHLLGYPASHQMLADGLDMLDSSMEQARSGGQRPLTRRPPVRTTAAAVCALADAGLPVGHRAQVAAATWLAGQQIARCPAGASAAAASGWSFAADGYPVAADTASVLVALSRVRRQGLAGQAGVTGALTWLISLQGRDGSWAGSALATCLAVRALAALRGTGERAVRRGTVWLMRTQRPDGSWAPRLGESALEVTSETLRALLAAGVLPTKPGVVAAIGWLASRQNSDGGWGPDRGPASRGLPPSQAGATARAVLALLAAGGDIASERAGRGTDWLVRAQRADGGWGPSVASLLLPLSALGRYHGGQARDLPADRLASASAGGAMTPRPGQPTTE